MKPAPPLFSAKQYLTGYALSLVALASVFLALAVATNARYAPGSDTLTAKTALVGILPFASPALVPAGRNIAFESGNGIANAPASYLTMLECCEADEAIADRIAVGQTIATVRKQSNNR